MVESMAICFALLQASLLVLLGTAEEANCLMQTEVGKLVQPEYSPREGNKRKQLDVDAVFNPSLLVGKRVLVTGSNRGIGLGLVRKLAGYGASVVATCRTSSPELDHALANGKHQILTGVDVASDTDVADMASKIDGSVDILVNNAGYYAEGPETLEKLDSKEDALMFEICAMGPLRVTKALRNAGKLQRGSKVITFTSQSGSLAWVEGGGDADEYGHHMSKAAANMGMVILANELKPEGIPVIMMHPGFVRTDMTKRFESSWGGALESDKAAKKILHQINLASMETTGTFINCEDGLQIPW